MNTANWNIEPHLASAALELRPGPLFRYPPKPSWLWARSARCRPAWAWSRAGRSPTRRKRWRKGDDNQKHYLERDPEVKCDLPGVPRANYMSLPFQIVQSGKTLLISYEYAGAVRNILFNDPGPAPVDSWMGQSVGKWEGDTLVVDGHRA